MKGKIAVLLVAALLLIVTIVPVMAITVEQDMYLLYKTDERVDESGNEYVDLIFCYVDAVSYTHLDVYKRQPHSQPISLAPQFFCNY